MKGQEDNEDINLIDSNNYNFWLEKLSTDILWKEFDKQKEKVGVAWAKSELDLSELVTYN